MKFSGGQGCWDWEVQGTSWESATYGCGIRLLSPQEVGWGQEDLGGGSQCRHVGHWLWHLPLCHLIQLQHWGCLYWSWDPTKVSWGTGLRSNHLSLLTLQDGWRCVWSCESLHHKGGGWTFPHWANWRSWCLDSKGVSWLELTLLAQERLIWNFWLGGKRIWCDNWKAKEMWMAGYTSAQVTTPLKATLYKSLNSILQINFD